MTDPHTDIVLATARRRRPTGGTPGGPLPALALLLPVLALAAVVVLGGTGVAAASGTPAAASRHTRAARSRTPAASRHTASRSRTPAASRHTASRSRTPAASRHSSADPRAAGRSTRHASNADPATDPQPPPAAAAQLVAPGQMIASGRDAPDPFMLAVGGRYYLYTSEGNVPGNNVPVQSGTTVGHWGRLGDAMPTLPSWAVPGFTWAPDVRRFGDHYVLYFTSIVAGTTPADQCIGVATGTSPAGPFVPEQRPFICQLDQRGSIDPRTFADPDGTVYMIWKSDDNADVTGTEPTNIYSQPLSADGLHLKGRSTRIFGPDEPWQGRIVEAPDLVLVGGTYWLFYSGYWFNQPTYAIGVARCSGPLGPCADTSSQPWLASNSQGQGPGEPFVFGNGSGYWLLYTPWRSDLPQPTTPPRPVAMLRLGFDATGPYVATPAPATADPPA